MNHRAPSPQALMQAVQSAHRDGNLTPVLSSGQGPATSQPDRQGQGQGLGHDLTRRERDLLKFMAQGLSNQDLATCLGIRLPTVKYHVGHILAKLNASNRTTAVLLALRHGLVDAT